MKLLVTLIIIIFFLLTSNIYLLVKLNKKLDISDSMKNIENEFRGWVIFIFAAAFIGALYGQHWLLQGTSYSTTQPLKSDYLSYIITLISIVSTMFLTVILLFQNREQQKEIIRLNKNQKYQDSINTKRPYFIIENIKTRSLDNEFFELSHCIQGYWENLSNNPNTNEGFIYIKNIGEGIAFNINIKHNLNIKDFDFNSLYINKEEELPIHFSIYELKPLASYSISITYNNINNNKYLQIIKITRISNKKIRIDDMTLQNIALDDWNFGIELSKD